MPKNIRLLTGGNFSSASGGGGGGSKSSKSPGCVSRRNKRVRNCQKRQARKDNHVFKSSHGHFHTVAALEKHRLKVTGKPTKKTRETTSLETPK